MPYKEPDKYEFFDWLILSIVALWASLSAFLQRNLTQANIKRKVYYALQDFIISSGTTYLVAIGLMSYGMSEGISIAVGGFAGHKVTRFTYLFELILTEKTGAKKTFDIVKEQDKGKQ